jgi:thiol reductant ABC exporter CydD subunit
MAAPLDRRLIRESRVARTHLALAAVLGVISAALIVAQAALLAYIIDRAAMRHATISSLRGELIWLTCVLFTRALVNGGFELSGRWGAVRVMSELRGRLVRRILLESPERRPNAGRTGELAGTAVQGVDALEAYFAGYLPQLVLAAVVPVAVIGWVISVDPITAGILALTVPLLILFMVLIGKGARAQALRRWRALSLLGAHFLDVVQGLATLRAYGREDAQEQTLAEVGERYRSETMVTLRTAFLSAFVLELCAMIGTALVAATIGVQLVSGTLHLQAGLTVLLLAPEMYGPLRLLGQQFHASTDASTASGAIFQALDSTPAITRARRPRSPVNLAASPVRFEAVSYEYPGRPGAALSGVDLQLQPGEITALVGQSGAGKSTLARLLMRLADPTRGRITCAGVDLRDLEPEAFRRQIAWVPQRPTLFTGTIAQNIALCNPGATQADIEQAAHAAGAEHFIRRLPQDFQTQVGEGARRLSAGQAQRVALARAFLADRPLLLLDEPTAHLDDESAQTISRTIRNLAQGRTTLLIVHHHLLTGIADNLHFIANGRLDAAPDDRLASLRPSMKPSPVAA